MGNIILTENGCVSFSNQADEAAFLAANEARHQRLMATDYDYRCRVEAAESERRCYQAQRRAQEAPSDPAYW